VTLPTEFVAHIAALLDQLGIPYQVGGSFASSAHGMYRASADADFVIDPDAAQLVSLAAALANDFYVTQSAMDEALTHRSTFNAIHNDSSFKIDFFIRGDRPFDVEELRRSVSQPLEPGSGQAVRIKSAEDTILRKLEWFRRGGEISERQWRDVLGVLAAVGKCLDDAYLDRWASELGVADLLERARGEVREI
jgi:hypothetical protein